MDKYAVIDNALLKVTYAFDRVQDVGKPEVRRDDTHVVLIGSETSRHYSRPFMEWAEDVFTNWAYKPIKFYDLKYTKVSRSEFQGYMVSMANDIAAFYAPRGVGTAVGGKILEHSPPIPYNPIERE